MRSKRKNQSKKKKEKDKETEKGKIKVQKKNSKICEVFFPSNLVWVSIQDFNPTPVFLLGPILSVKDNVWE